MGLNIRYVVISISILGLFHSHISADNMKDHPYNPLSKHLITKCNKENALFPEPPCCGMSSQKLSGRIAGGKITELNEFPWMVYICTGQSFGGATLINSRWVLTAGHNVVNSTAALRVILGLWYKSSLLDCANLKGYETQMIKVLQVDKVIIYELYNEKPNSMPEHDIALLRLSESVTFTNHIRPICLPLNGPEVKNFANVNAIAAGWGQTEHKAPSSVLLKTLVTIWDPLRCQEYAINKTNVICADGLGDSGICTGDSGGPLMLPLVYNVYEVFYQIGVVSYGSIPCGESGGKGVFAYVPSYIKWINDTMLKYQ